MTCDEAANCENPLEFGTILNLEHHQLDDKSMDKLAEIMAAKRHALRNQIRPVRDQELERLGRMQSQGGSFLKALARKDRLSVIAEIKRKSPSAG